jgi:hypothetical protein
VKNEKLIKGNYYLFSWLDTYNFNEWHSEKDIDEKTVNGAFQESAGFFVKKYRNWIIIAMHRNTNAPFMEWGDVCWIPKGSILKIKRLR